MAGISSPFQGSDSEAISEPFDGTTGVPPLPRRFGDGSCREQLGRFRLVEKLGEGGTGTVYRAEDLADGTIVAVKVLHPHWTGRPRALRRFAKEARLLAEVNNPYVANLLEVDVDHGVHYLVTEFIGGKSLAALLAERGRLEESVALAVMADIARALVDAHRRGIVHRDVKPDNILFVTARATPGSTAAHEYSCGFVKLTDFGLARHVIESASLEMTGPGAMVGTPLYMSPEQWGGAVDARTDVYAMGATLFHLLAGRPPFVAENAGALHAMHQNDEPPSLGRLNPTVSEGVCQVVDRTLAKRPDQRYADAAALLVDLERVIRGYPIATGARPLIPDCDPRSLLEYAFRWDLEATPEQLWPHVANTSRVNHAVGLPAVRFTARSQAGRGVRRFGEVRKIGLTFAWEEYPFEWVEGQRMGVLREFSRGPFHWLASEVELKPRPGGGTTLTHHIRLQPRNFLGRLMAAVEVGLKARRAFDRLYRRTDAAVTGKLGDPVRVDPFVESEPLASAPSERLNRLLDKLTAHHLDPAVLVRLGDFVAQAPAQEVARIRPLALARRLNLDPDQVVAACLHGAKEGLFVLLWDVLCPLCRVPSEVTDTLRLLRDHGRCEVCNLDFELDLANSVELIFRAHPQIRKAEVRTYCVGGPSHFPHVAAQVRIGPSEQVRFDLALAEGDYRVIGTPLPGAIAFKVRPAAPNAHWELCLAGDFGGLPTPLLRTGRQTFTLTNDHAHELLVRVERSASREDGLTAARASAMCLFRDLFPGEVLAPGQLVRVADTTLLVTDLGAAPNLYEELGDARAFAVIHDYFRLLDDCIRREGGALVKTVGEGVVAVFSDSAAAVRVALGLPDLHMNQSPGTKRRPRVAVHQGPARAATLNDRLDYFGATVSLALALPHAIDNGELVLTPIVASDPEVIALFRALALVAEPIQTKLTGRSPTRAYRIVLPELDGRSNGRHSEQRVPI